MNRKGFTLIELLAVIIVLGLVLVISIPSLTGAYKKAKLKSEEAFVERLSQAVDSYTTLKGSSLTFGNCTSHSKEENGSNYDVTVCSTTIYVQDLISDNIFTEDNFINPSTKLKCDKASSTIEIYKDSDYVYCHKIGKNNLKYDINTNCLSENYIDSLGEDIYIVDTCSWSSDK